MKWTDKVKKILKKYWKGTNKITNLKDKQIETINELLLGNDVIGLLPTGYGKSLCYLLPPLITKKTIFIISPLISLMEDQIEKLVSMGIKCSALHSNNVNKSIEIEKIIDGTINIVYMSPEFLINSDGMSLAETLIENGKMGFLAIDESHCVSGWGHDFRPEYIQIKKFRISYPDIPIMAVTATATTQVCKDIAVNLLLNNPVTVRASFDRPNLYIEVTGQKKIGAIGCKKGKCESRINRIAPYIDKYPNDKIIIYTNSRKSTEELANEINKKKPGSTAHYHAGLSQKVREKVQNDFSEGKVKIIVSTIAFGMGIDQIVRCVLVVGSPSSVEEFYQQIGRGGRDGLPCETVLCFEESQYIIRKIMIEKELKPYDPLYKVKMNNMIHVKKLFEIKSCRRKFILEYFNEKCDFDNCNNCDNCIRLNKVVSMSITQHESERMIDIEKNKEKERDELFDSFESYSKLLDKPKKCKK